MGGPRLSVGALPRKGNLCPDCRFSQWRVPCPGVPAIRGVSLPIEPFQSNREPEFSASRTDARPTPRAILYGLAGVLFLCVVTPYTDLELRGSWLAHNCLPIGAL